MNLLRRTWIMLLALGLVGLLAMEASARGGGPGGGGRGGPGGMGRGGGPGGMGRGGGPGGMGRGGMGGRMGGPGGGFGMRGNRNGQTGKTAKEWEVLQNIEERKALIQQRRERLMDVDRKLQQETYLATLRAKSAVSFGVEGARR